MTLFVFLKVPPQKMMVLLVHTDWVLRKCWPKWLAPRRKPLISWLYSTIPWWGWLKNNQNSKNIINPSSSFCFCASLWKFLLSKYQLPMTNKSITFNKSILDNLLQIFTTINILFWTQLVHSPHIFGYL